MQVKIKNHLLEQSIGLLFNLSLKGKQSRHRTKFVKQLNERLQEVAEQEKEVIKENCHLDDEGNPKTINDGKTYDVKDMDALVKDKQELLNEEMVIDGGDSQSMLMTIRTVLDECDKEFSGQEAVLYEYLCEQFKVDEDIENTKEKDDQ